MGCSLKIHVYNFCIKYIEVDKSLLTSFTQTSAHVRCCDLINSACVRCWINFTSLSMLLDKFCSCWLLWSDRLCPCWMLFSDELCQMLGHMRVH